MSIFEHPEFDQHEQVKFCFDPDTGLKAIIAVHNTNLGASLGGCRMWPYSSSEEALTDVLRLSKGMTYKAALANLPQGGGKSVIIGCPRQDKTAEMMQSMGRFIESLGGSYIGAEDSGMTVEDIHEMAKFTPYVSGINGKFDYLGNPSDGNPAPSTAYGVFMGIKSSVKHALGADLKGVRVAIQGVGHVGIRLAEHLHREGAELIVSDIFADNLKLAEERFDALVVAPDEIIAQEVDVFAPCALGAALNEQSINCLKAKVVAGAANNQLATEDIGNKLVDMDVLYAPDYVINAGGIIGIYHQEIESNSDSMRSHLEGIGETLLQIYQQAKSSGEATNSVANTMAEQKFGTPSNSPRLSA